MDEFLHGVVHSAWCLGNQELECRQGNLNLHLEVHHGSGTVQPRKTMFLYFRGSWSASMIVAGRVSLGTVVFSPSATPSGSATAKSRRRRRRRRPEAELPTETVRRVPRRKTNRGGSEPDCSTIPVGYPRCSGSYETGRQVTSLGGSSVDRHPSG